MAQMYTKSFTRLTGTPLNQVRHKGLLLLYAVCMKEGMSVRDTADAHAAGHFGRTELGAAFRKERGQSLFIGAQGGEQFGPVGYTWQD